MENIEKKYISWKEIKLKIKDFPKGKYYGVPRGGMYIAALLNPVDTPEEADYIVDDLIDSGKTEEKYLKYNKPFFSLFDKRKGDKKWFVFPWEKKDESDIEDHLLRIAQYMNIKINIQK